MNDKMKNTELDFDVVMSNKKDGIPYRCPVCNGTCRVPHSFYSPHDNTTISNADVDCRSCDGTGIVWTKMKQNERY